MLTHQQLYQQCLDQIEHCNQVFPQIADAYLHGEIHNHLKAFLHGITNAHKQFQTHGEIPKNALVLSIDEDADYATSITNEIIEASTNQETHYEYLERMLRELHSYEERKFNSR